MPASSAEFQAVQRDFAAYIRHPQRNPLPAGVDERRMRIYARLFYNNVEGFLADTLRTFRQITNDDCWHALVRDFLHRHRAASPYYLRIPEEFLHYLGDSRRNGPPISPFAVELCHYEWVRAALRSAPDAVDVVFGDAPLDIDEAPMLSPLAWPLRYDFPVQRIGPNYQPAEPPTEATFLIGCRNRDDEVRFIESNAVTTRLLQLIDEGNDCRASLTKVGAESGLSFERATHFGMATLNRLHGLDVVVRRKVADTLEQCG